VSSLHFWHTGHNVIGERHPIGGTGQHTPVPHDALERCDDGGRHGHSRRAGGFQMGKRFFAAELTASPRRTSLDSIMGHTHVTVAVSNLQKSKPAYTASFLVDTGAI